MAPGGGPAPSWLAAVALGAAALNQVFWLLPLALMLGLPALWYGNVVLSGVALAAFLLLAWVFQPREADPPHELSPDDAPLLFERVHALADALRAPRVHAVALNDELNAGAVELNRGVSLRPVKRVLILGRPLLDAPAAEAVIAHELGHFSRRHGRLGHWLYGTRQSWVVLSRPEHDLAADSSAWERAAAGFATRFLPWFDRLSFAHMRRCEFEADALAAEVVGPAALARALVLLQHQHRQCERMGERALRQLMRRHAEPPADLLEREVAAWRHGGEGACAVPPDEAEEGGTHPPLAQRLAALGVAAQHWPWPDTSAAALWLGGRALQLATEPADAATRLRWAMGHRLMRGLAAGPDAALARRWQLALAFGEPAPTQPLSDSPLELLLRARFELEAGHRETARALLEACRAHKTGERDVATAWLVEHALGQDPEDRRRHEAWLQRVRQRREAAAEDLVADREQGRVDVAPLQGSDCRAIAEALHAHPAIREAWLFGQAATVQDVAYQAAVLLMRVDPQQMATLKQDEEDLAALTRELLGWIAPPGLLRLVLVRYTTEGIAPRLAQALAGLASTRLL
jgi:Zn-dependent protease with chaperone function